MAVYNVWAREQDRASLLIFFDQKDGAVAWAQQYVYLFIVTCMGDPGHLTRPGQEESRRRL
jgi:hypothetical protein